MHASIIAGVAATAQVTVMTVATVAVLAHVVMDEDFIIESGTCEVSQSVCFKIKALMAATSYTRIIVDGYG